MNSGTSLCTRVVAVELSRAFERAPLSQSTMSNLEAVKVVVSQSTERAAGAEAR